MLEAASLLVLGCGSRDGLASYSSPGFGDDTKQLQIAMMQSWLELYDRCALSPSPECCQIILADKVAKAFHVFKIKLIAMQSMKAFC